MLPQGGHKNDRRDTDAGQGGETGNGKAVWCSAHGSRDRRDVARSLGPGLGLGPATGELVKAGLRAKRGTGVQRRGQPRLRLGIDGTGHDIARGQFGIGVGVQHEPFAVAID